MPNNLASCTGPAFRQRLRGRFRLPTQWRFLVLVLALNMFASVSWACSCGRAEPARCGRFGEEDIIFVGTVLSLDDGGYHFRIDENITGAPGRSVDVVSIGPCAYPFHEGDQYLVIGSNWSSYVHVTICSGTRPIEEAKALLPQLRAIRDRRRVASLYGRLIRTQQPYIKALDDAYNQPLAKTILRASSGTKIFETRSDNDGVYSFYGLPSGTYHLSAVLPPGLEIAQTILSGPPPDLQLPAGACYEHDVEALPSGRIHGRVLGPGGEPLRAAGVDLFRVDQYDEKKGGWWGFQDEKGSFEFRHVAPGDYVLVFNNLDRLDPDAPFPRTFYSSATNLPRSQVIHLTAGEQFLDADIHVNGGRSTRRLTVNLKWEGEKPSDNDVVVVDVKGSEGDAPHVYQLKPGVYEITLLQNGQYTLHATQYCLPCTGNGCVREWKTAEVKVQGADERITETSLVFPPGGCRSLHHDASKPESGAEQLQ